MRRALLVVVALASACRSREEPTVRPDPVTSAPSLSATHADPPPPLPAPPDDDAVRIILTKTQLLVDEDVVLPLPSPADGATSGFGAKYKPSASSLRPIAPLTKALDAHFARSYAGRTSAQALLLAAGATPYRVLAEVLFTLGYARIEKPRLLILRDTTSPPARTAATLPPITMHAGKPLGIELDVGFDGVSFRTTAGPLGTGCTPGSSGVTVPRVAGALDLDGVRRCAQRLKSGAADDTGVSIGAMAATPYVEIIAVMDAVQTDGHVALFPDVSFGVPR